MKVKGSTCNENNMGNYRTPSGFLFRLNDGREMNSREKIGWSIPFLWNWEELKLVLLPIFPLATHLFLYNGAATRQLVFMW